MGPTRKGRPSKVMTPDSKTTSSTPRQNSIAKVSVSGYKSIMKEQSIEIAPLTILAGANSSGKSSMLQPILLLKQTLESQVDPGPLLLDGPNVKFTSSEQLLSRIRKEENSPEMSIRVTLQSSDSVQFCFKKGDPGLFLGSTKMTADSHEFTLLRDMAQDEIAKAIPKELSKFAEMVRGKPDQESNRTQWEVKRDRCFFQLMIRWGEGMLIEPPGMGPLRVGELVKGELLGVIHLPGLRGNPERTYPLSAVGKRFPGVFQPYAASVISEWQQANNDELMNALGDNLRSLGLTWKVYAKRVEETKVELSVGRMTEPQQGGAYDLVSIADVGVGVSQVLPVLVALLVAQPGCILYLEQPEIHLHPRAQVALAKILVDASKKGVKVVVETHSAILLLSVQTLVAKGILAPEDVRLHWFARSRGATEIKTADLEKDGSFGNWPEDFGKVQLEVQSEYLDAAEQMTLSLQS